MAGGVDKRAGTDSPKVQIPKLVIFSLHPSATIREQDIRMPSNFDSNYNVTLRVLIIVLL